LPPAPAGRGQPTSITQTFIDAALAMQGAPYRYGGESPLGFDCSGLVAYAAKRAGFEVPRTAREQLQSGIPVNRQSLQPGDLVFMRLPNELHVGIVTGDGRFVHAPKTGGRVRLDQLEAQPYRDGFVAGRRIQP
jgi:cell wall-associated NlpC family hydrolase